MRKNFRTIICIIIILVLSATILCSCGTGELYSAAEFDDYCDELVNWFLDGDALSINFILSDPSTYSLENSTATLYTPTLEKDKYESGHSAYSSLIANLYKFNYSAFSNAQKDLWTILLNYFQSIVNSKDYYYFQSGYLGSVSGTNNNLPTELAEYKFTKKLDVENYLSLLEQSTDAFKSYCDYEKIRIDAGFGRGDYIYQGIVDQCNGFAPVGNDASNFLVANFNNKIDACDFLNATEKADFKAKNLSDLSTYLLPAYRTTATTVATFIGNANNNALGLAKYTNGQSYYQYKFSQMTSTSDSVETAYSNLVGFYNSSLRAYSACRSTYTSTYPDGDLSADITALTDGQDFSLTNLNATLANLKADIASDFPSLPSTIPDVTFNFVDASVADFYSPAAYYMSTVDSLSSPEIVYINATKGDNGYNVYELLSHETYPGHLLQNSYFKSTGISPLRRLVSFTGYAEGWGNYSQFYTSKYFDGTAKEKLAYNIYQQNSILSGIRVSMVDILVNYYGYSVAQVAEVLGTMISLTGEELTNYAQNLVEFVAENPANYPAYYYGYYKMLVLRDKYSSALGSQYTDLKFHTAVLAAGPMSYEQLTKKLVG